MSIKRQSVLADLMNNIGKQVEGWKKVLPLTPELCKTKVIPSVRLF